MQTPTTVNLASRTTQLLDNFLFMFVRAYYF